MKQCSSFDTTMKYVVNDAKVVRREKFSYNFYFRGDNGCYASRKTLLPFYIIIVL